MQRNNRLILLIMSLILMSCGGGGKQKTAVAIKDRQVNVVTTIGMITDIALNVGGDRVKVSGLMKPGVDPHLYRASAGDISTMTESDVVFYGGLHLEGKMVEILEQSTRLNAHAVTHDIPEDRLLLAQASMSGIHDPHIWFDVSLWEEAVKKVEKELIAIDPEHEEVYKSNASEYLEKLDKLHAYVMKKASELKKEQRVLITAHDAFGYFGRQYGFEVLGLQGISTVSEAKVSDYQELANLIVDRKVPAIFVESSVPRKSIEALQEAVKSKGFEVRIGGELFSDSMGDSGTEEGTYIGMVKHNIDTIVNALK